MNRIVRYGLLLIFSAWAWLLQSCDSGVVYKAYENFDGALWYIKTTPTFRVEIRDTTRTYKVYYLVRNSMKYPYYNLYVTREITGPDGKKEATLSELFLSNEKTGKPFGNGLGDIFDHKIVFLRNHRFTAPGTYTFTFSQTMRQNPLPHILGVGISVEKADR